MMRSMGSVVLVVLLTGVALSASQPRQAESLRQQVQATDALGALLDQQTAEAEDTLAGLRKQQGGSVAPPPATLVSPANRAGRLSYDAAFRAALQYIEQGGDEAADPLIDQLSVDQLRRELAVLHVHNLGVYVQLNRRLDELDARQAAHRNEPAADRRASATRPALGPTPLTSADDILHRLAALGQATTQPTRHRPRDSAIAALHHPEDAAPQYDVPNQLKSAGDRAQSVEQPEPSAMSGAQVAAAVMSGAALPGTFGVPSVVAPMNARRPGSEPLNGISPSSFPMMSFAPGGMPMPATPPGTPASVVPSPEAVQTLSGLLGVTPDQALVLMREGGTISQMRQAAGRAGGGSASPAGASSTLSTSATSLSASDPRWRAFYYGALVRENFWSPGSGDSFDFRSGGGTYQRQDPRVNQDFDLRLNGDLDRRVNSGADRRLNIQVDPRANY